MLNLSWANFSALKASLAQTEPLWRRNSTVGERSFSQTEKMTPAEISLSLQRKLPARRRSAPEKPADSYFLTSCASEADLCFHIHENAQQIQTPPPERNDWRFQKSDHLKKWMVWTLIKTKTWGGPRVCPLVPEIVLDVQSELVSLCLKDKGHLNPTLIDLNILFCINCFSWCHLRSSESPGVVVVDYIIKQVRTFQIIDLIPGCVRVKYSQSMSTFI